jgi:hypothetical protein
MGLTTIALSYRNLYHLGMKTTLDLNDAILIQAKSLAAQQRTSLTRLIEEGLQLRLQSNLPKVKRSNRKMPTFNGKSGFKVGIDPMSNRSIYDALEYES